MRIGLLLLIGCAPIETAPLPGGSTTSDGSTWITPSTSGPSVPTSSTTEVETGDTGTLLFPDDADADGIPDDYDPFPNDDQRPGVAVHETVYAHDATTLHFMNVLNYNLGTIGTFSYATGPGGSMTDIAIDRYGVLYGCTYTDLYVCHPQTAECWHLGPLAGNYNGLTFVPPGTMDPYEDVLVAIEGSGDWFRLDGYLTQQLTTTLVGGYGLGYFSSGDAFSIDGVGSWAAVNSDDIVTVDPISGAVGGDFASAGSNTWGLAGWLDVIFAFDAGGQVFAIDPGTGVSQEVQNAPNAWWGAGVRTWIPANP